MAYVKRRVKRGLFCAFVSSALGAALATGCSSDGTDLGSGGGFGTGGSSGTVGIAGTHNASGGTASAGRSGVSGASGASGSEAGGMAGEPGAGAGARGGSGGSDETGGSIGSAGNRGFGGTSGSGGASGAAGASGAGGASGHGGASGAGGATGHGGASGAGGASGHGGVAGASGAGGVGGAGGRGGASGAAGTGGVGGSGGTPPDACHSCTEVSPHSCEVVGCALHNGACTGEASYCGSVPDNDTTNCTNALGCSYNFATQHCEPSATYCSSAGDVSLCNTQACDVTGTCGAPDSTCSTLGHTACETDTNCYWGPSTAGSCHGTPAACGSATTSCILQHGCALAPGCHATVDCSSFHTSDSCPGVDNCTWSLASSTCGPTHACDLATTPMECSNTSLTCEYSTTCVGTPTACATFGTIDDCGRQAGCAWGP